MFLSARQAAELLCVSKQTICKLVEKGELKAYRIGNLLKFKQEDIDNYVERQGTK